MLIQYAIFLILAIDIITVLFHNTIIVIVIITVALVEIVIAETEIVAILKERNACLQTTLEKLIVKFKVNNKYTKNNIN